MGRSLAAVVVWLFVTSATAAEVKPEFLDPLTNIGSTTRALGDEAVEIRVEINPRNATEGKAPVVQEVVHDGILKNAGMFTAALKPATGRGAYLVIAPAGGASVKPGTYTIQVELPQLPKTPPEAGAPAAEGRLPQQVIKVTLTRGGQPKSAVVMPSPLKIERIISLFGVSYEPKEWMMRETTGEAPLIPDPKETSAHLVSQTTSGLGMVNVTFPARIEAAQEGKAQVALAGGPQRWIGNATATVLLRSVTMAKPLTTYSVEVRSRYSYFLLFLTIIAGIVAGIIVNRALVPKIADMTARAKAASELARIVAIRDTFVDAEVAAELNRIAADLTAAIHDKTFNGAAVTTAATFAAGEADRIAGAARSLANDITNRLNYLLDLVRHPEA